MKKLATLCLDSYAEFKQVKTLTVVGMLGALSIVLGYFTVAIGDFMKIGFSTVANQVVYYLFGPVLGGFYGAALDILKYWMKPTGAYFPGFTLTAILAGVIYGFFLYKKPINFWRILAAELTVSIICNMLLGTLWLTLMYDRGFLAILPVRVLKNLIQCPINAGVVFMILMAVESSGIKRYIKS